MNHLLNHWWFIQLWSFLKKHIYFCRTTFEGVYSLFVRILCAYHKWIFSHKMYIKILASKKIYTSHKSLKKWSLIRLISDIIINTIGCFITGNRSVKHPILPFCCNKVLYKCITGAHNTIFFKFHDKFYSYTESKMHAVLAILTNAPIF